ncbi:phosphonate C-P lyase system protein PhnG [Flavimaribacter sediminis]
MAKQENMAASETAIDETSRGEAMAVLARATQAELEAAWSDWRDKPEVEPVRGPETGLVMLRGRIGGGGSPFNFGEATVTRATVRLSTGQVGHAYALGTSKGKVRYAAIFDALWQDEQTRDDVEDAVLAPVRRRVQARNESRAAEAAATKVDFFTMVRGED